MDINPHKIEEPNYVPIAEKAPKPWYVILFLALAGMAGAYFVYTLWLNLSVMKNWPTVTYIDCLFYPLREEEVRQKQGIYLIEKAELQERLGNSVQARSLFSDGLKKNPSIWTARLQLARLTQNAPPKSNARLLLREGFQFSAGEPRFLDGVINFAWEARDYEFMVEACAVGLDAAQRAGDQARIVTLTEQKAYALLYNGDPLGALAALPELKDDVTEEQIVDRGTQLLRIQLPLDALRFLSKWQSRMPDSLKILRLLARAQREVDDLDGMEATLAKGVAAHPNTPAAWSTIVVNRSKASNLSGARDALEKYFVMFYGNPNNLTLMGQELASIDDHVLLAECVAESDRLGYAGIDLRELLVELHTKRSDWKKVTELLIEIATRKARLNFPADRWQIFYESLCAAALDSDPAKQQTFLSILREEQTTATSLAYETFIKLLGLEDRVETARNIALLARQRFPETRDWLAFARQFEMRRAGTYPNLQP